MEFIETKLDKFNTKNGVLVKLYSTYCKVFGHKYELIKVVNNDMPFRAYQCTVCGNMSFTIFEDKETAPLTKTRFFIKTFTHPVVLLLLFQIIREFGGSLIRI